MAKNYWEKLQDPRWQKKRLEVMQDAGFKCELCEDESNTLNVHHKEYFKGREPWEYNNTQLVCLCVDCHETLHDYVDMYKLVGSYAKTKGLESRFSLSVLMAGYRSYSLDSFLDIAGLAKTKEINVLYRAGVQARKYVEKRYDIGGENA